MSTNGNRYPRRGEHGDPTPVCEWCGNRVNIARLWREFGSYCSIDCKAADRRGFYTCFLITSLIFLFGSVRGILVGYEIAPLIVIAIYSFVLLLYSGGMAYLGLRVVQSQTEPIDEAELEKVCSTLIETLHANQTSKGVSRKVLLTDLRSKGFSNRTIISGVEHLLVSGKIRQIGFGHYTSVS